MAHVPALSHRTKHSIKGPFEEEPSSSLLYYSAVVLGSLSRVCSRAKDLWEAEEEWERTERVVAQREQEVEL